MHKGSGRFLVRRLIREHLSAYFPIFLRALILMIVVALTTAALPYLLKPMFDDVLNRGDPGRLWILSSIVFGTFALKGIASYGESVTMTTLGQRLITDIQKRVFAHMIRLDLDFFKRSSTGELMSRLMNDVTLMRQAMTSTVLSVGKDTLTLIFLIGVMVLRDPGLSVLSLILFPTAVWPILRIGKRMRKVTQNTQDHMGKLTQQINQVIQSIRVVKAYHQEEAETERMSTHMEGLFHWVCRSARIRSLTHPLMEILGGIAIIGVLTYGGCQVIKGERTAGEFVSFIGALLLLYEPMKRLSHVNTHLQEGISAGLRVFKLIDTVSQLKDPENPCPLPTVQGSVRFDDVCFSYTDSVSLVLDHLSFTIPEGSWVAFVGPSGSGKSTLINLIPRFYDVNSGAVFVDETDVRSVTTLDLRSHLAFVSQDIALFEGTISENIRYGLPHASHEEIEGAAKSAAAHEFIIRLPKGYDTPIGENGVKLSGGQRQRLALARALVRKARIILLDEATSALDTESERHIQSALQDLHKTPEGRPTLIMVAHRLSTVVDADTVYVLNEGNIVEKGSHADLLELKGVYARLWHQQAREPL